MTQGPEKPWSVTVRLDEVPEAGRHVDLQASEAVCLAVARAVNVDAVEQLSAAFDLTRRGRDGLRVLGTVRATVRQTCVVTLEPVANSVAEAVDVTFAPPRDANAPETAEDDDELDVAGTIAGDDPPEPLLHGAVDLGALAVEFLMLSIDPYPRKEGAAFAAPTAGDSGAHPFAGLAALKNANKLKD